MSEEMSKEFFDYLIVNQPIWAKIYKEQELEHHRNTRLKYMIEYNKTYNIVNREAIKARNKEKKRLKRKYDLENIE